MAKAQDKAEEVRFFDGDAAAGAYEAFTPDAYVKLVGACITLAGFPPGARVLDLGCGSGPVTRELAARGLRAGGVDISFAQLVHARRRDPRIPVLAVDIERLPFADGALDGVLLSGVVHHFPDPGPCAREVARVLKSGGRFAAFDPNRRNPAMWLYRDWDSPIRSPVGVTANERPVLAEEVRRVFEAAGLTAQSHYLSGLSFRMVASPAAQLALPIYNAFDAALQALPFARSWRAFVITVGAKP